MAPTLEAGTTKRSLTARDSAAVARNMMATMCEVRSLLMWFWIGDWRLDVDGDERKDLGE